jgi:hypothetical protein
MSEDTITNGNGTTPQVRWKNRRRMAWVSLISMIVLTYTIIFTDTVPDSKLTILSDVITWFYFSMATVVGCYMGMTTWAHIKK